MFFFVFVLVIIYQQKDDETLGSHIINCIVQAYNNHEKKQGNGAQQGGANRQWNVQGRAEQRDVPVAEFFMSENDGGSKFMCYTIYLIHNLSIHS